jgi:F-type H+-transporting ATPase subunit a
VPDQSRPVQIAQAPENRQPPLPRDQVDRDKQVTLTQDEHSAPEKGAGEHAGGAAHAGEAHGGHHAYKLGDIPAPGVLFWNGLFVAIIMIVFAKVAVSRRMKAIPSGAQNFGEFIAESMVNFTRGIIGPGGEKYVPLVGTVFFFILLGNLIGQIPYFNSPTANLSTTLALGLIVFIYVQYVGIRANGLGGYVKHFMGPMPALSPLLFPVEVISELVKPFTLAMRLFGNIFGEDTVIIVLASLAVMILPKAPILPVQFPILVLGLLTSFVQALVFSLLTCIYISLQSHHDSEHEGHGHSPGHGHPGIEESGLVP